MNVARRFRACLTGVAALALLAGCTAHSPTVDFSCEPTSGPAPLSVGFHALVSGAARSYAWDFGDGAESAERDPAHVYAQAGTYSVALSVTTAAGTGTERKAGLIRVTASDEPDALVWFERGSGVIWRGSLDGGASAIVVAGLIGPEDVAVAGGRVYWTDPGAGSVETARLDGSDRRALATGENYPTGVAVDVVRAKAYWTTLPSAADAMPVVEGTIKRANLDGTGVETLATFAPQSSFAWQIALDAAAGWLYWIANDWVGIAASARAADCRGKILRADLDAKGVVVLAGALCAPTDLALGDGHVYWTDEDAAAISRLATSGGVPAVLVHGQTEAESVAVSQASGKIYWTAGSTLSRANLDGSGVEVLYNGLNLPEGLALGH